jgi:transposase, IS30 family
MKGYRRIGYEDRCQIYALSREGVTQAEIAATLGFSQGSVSRELKRNRGRRGYRFKQAQVKADDRQLTHAKPYKLAKRVRRLIEGKLRQERWSPEQISGWLKGEHSLRLSHEWIYQMIWEDKHAGGELWRCLRRRGKRYNKRSGQNAGRGVIPNRIDITERPAIVDRKTRLGDWEGDTIASARHIGGGLLTHVERKSLLTKIAKLPRTTAKATHRATVRHLKPLQDFVFTVTYDNGKEFAAHQKIAKALQATVYFATPYHAWERGLNENTNGLIRDFFPKGTDFATVHHATVAKVERLLNTRPRKTLGFKSPQEVFNALSRRA